MLTPCQASLHKYTCICMYKYYKDQWPVKYKGPKHKTVDNTFGKEKEKNCVLIGS